MLEMRPNCERCDRDLEAFEAGACVCSFECTFCAPCATQMEHNCPNCGGELVARPTRTKKLLEKFPASTERVLNKK